MRGLESVAVADLDTVVGKMVHHLESKEGKFYSDVVLDVKIPHGTPYQRIVELRMHGTVTVNTGYFDSTGKRISSEVAYES